jgi:hypothetical protein
MNAVKTKHIMPSLSILTFPNVTTRGMYMVAMHRIYYAIPDNSRESKTGFVALGAIAKPGG